MSQTDFESGLEGTVQRLTEKAQRARDARSMETKVSRASENIKQLNRELERVERKISTLLFYDGVSQEVFDDERSNQVDEMLKSVRNTVDISEDDLVDHADSGDVRGLIDAIDDRKDDLDKAKEEIIDDIREHQNHWENEIESARDLNSIIGGGSSDFESVLEEMKRFVDEEIWDESRNPTTLATRWSRLTEQWEQNAGRHGWDEFQKEHELTDDTISALKQFAEKGQVRLNQLSVSIVEELKSVEELDSAIRLEIDTR